MSSNKNLNLVTKCYAGSILILKLFLSDITLNLKHKIITQLAKSEINQLKSISAGSDFVRLNPFNNYISMNA